MCVDNCTSSGTIIGADNVGGIFGGDVAVAQAWNAYTFKNNTFTGKVKCDKWNERWWNHRLLQKFEYSLMILQAIHLTMIAVLQKVSVVLNLSIQAVRHTRIESGAAYFNTANGTDRIAEGSMVHLEEKS